MSFCYSSVMRLIGEATSIFSPSSIYPFSFATAMSSMPHSNDLPDDVSSLGHQRHRDITTTHSARRKLDFGEAIDHEEIASSLKRENMILLAEESARYNFDFATERPLNDAPDARYEWSPIISDSNNNNDSANRKISSSSDDTITSARASSTTASDSATTSSDNKSTNNQPLESLFLASNNDSHQQSAEDMNLTMMISTKSQKSESKQNDEVCKEEENIKSTALSQSAIQESPSSTTSTFPQLCQSSCASSSVVIDDDESTTSTSNSMASSSTSVLDRTGASAMHGRYSANNEQASQVKIGKQSQTNITDYMVRKRHGKRSATSAVKLSQQVEKKVKETEEKVEMKEHEHERKKERHQNSHQHSSPSKRTRIAAPDVEGDAQA